MADEHLQKALADLISQRERKAAEFNAELARLDNAIEAVRTLVQPDGQPGPGGISIQSVDSLKMQDGASVAVARAVQPGDFFAMSQADAAREYLKRLGRAATLDDIFSALQRGGVRFQGKDPKKNLYISLTLRKTLFVSVAPQTFGLWDFYPNAKEKTGERLSAQIEELMQDGKGHKVAEIIKTLEEKFGQKLSRSTVVSVLLRQGQYRKVRRGMFKLRREAGS